MNDSTEKAQGTTSSAALRRAAPRHTSLAGAFASNHGGVCGDGGSTAFCGGRNYGVGATVLLAYRPLGRSERRLFSDVSS